MKRRIDAASNGYYKRLCDSLDAAIDAAFGIAGTREDPSAAEIIKTADGQALLIESQELLHDGGEALRADLEIPHNVLDLLPALPDLLSPELAEEQFLAVHRRLGGASGRRELTD